MPNLTDSLMTPAAAPAAPAEGNFSQGLRQGMTAAGGQLHALAGGVGEYVGAKDFARDQYAQSKVAQELAATQAPAINDWRQVTNAPDLSTGLRNAGGYIAGLAGQSLPAVGLGLGAGAATALSGGGALPALLAGTAAVAPLETGGAIERQQADPAALANNSAGTRLGTAALEGVGRALAMNAVPQLMGGKLLGSGLGAASKAGVLAESIGGNAAAGAGAEKISSMAQDSLNPNRDTSGDDNRMLDAAVSGAALGVPFAGAGLVGHALHGQAPEAGRPIDVPVGEGIGAAAPAKADAPTSLADRIKNVFAKDGGDDAAQKIAAGKDVIDVDALKTAPPEQQVQMLRDADAQRVETTKTWAQELMQDGTLSDENKAQLAQAAQDFTSRANQAVVAGMKVAQDGGKKAIDIATSFLNAVSPKKDGETDQGRAVQKSEQATGAEQAITSVIAPHLAKNMPDMGPDTVQRMAGGMRQLMQKMQDTGSIQPAVADHLQRMFGKDAASVMTDLHEQVLDSSDKAATDNYFRAVNKLDSSVDTRTKLIDMMKGALPDDMRASSDQLNQMAQHIQEYVSGATLDGKTPEQRVAYGRQIEAALRDHFGEKTGDILEAARVSHEMERSQDAADLEHAREDNSLPDDHVEYAGNSDDGFADSAEAGVTTERDLDRQYFGQGRDASKPQFMPTEQLHRQLYGNEDSAAAKVMRKVASENPDKNVSYVTAEQYARDHGAAPEDLRAMGMKGEAKDNVLVRAEGQKREGLSWGDVDRVRLDTHRFPDSRSRIESESGDHKFDAMKVANMFASHDKLPFDENDMANGYTRLRRRFVEGIGALSDHIGEPIHVQQDGQKITDMPEGAVTDDTVIAHRNGQPITWKEVREKGRIKPNEQDAAMSRLYRDRENAVKGGDANEIMELDKEIDRRSGWQAPREGEPGSAGLARAAKDLGTAQQRLQREMGRNGPLTDEKGKQVRAMLPSERTRLREYNEARGRYERAQADLEYARRDGEVHERTPDGTMLTRKGGDGEASFTASQRMEGGSWSGTTETAPDAQVHLANAEHSGVKGDALYGDWKDPATNNDTMGGKFAASRNMEAGPEGNMLHAANFEPDTHFDGRLPVQIKGAISSAAATLAAGKSAAQRALGAKAQHLLSVVDQMKRMDAADLASIVKDKDTASRAATINGLYRKYGALKAQEPRSTFVNRVVGKGNVSDVIRSIKVSDDARGVQRAIDALLPHQHDASARAVLNAANERMADMLEKDPSRAYSMQRVDPANSTTSSLRASVKDHIEKVLAKSVDVEFAKMLHAGEFFTDPSRAAHGMAPDVIRISTHSLDPMSTAYHESMHAFMAQLADAKLMDEAHPLRQAADSKFVRGQLEKLLAGEPDALRQLDDPHERAAYMYQFWAADKLKLRGRPEGVMGHVADLFKKTLGIWTNDQRAEHIMDHFNSGEYAKKIGDRGAVARVLLEGTNPTVDRFKSMVAPLGRLASAVASTGDARLRGTGIDALSRLADKVYAPLHGEHGGDPGYLPAARAKRGEVMNRLASELGQHEPGAVTDALVAMQQGGKGSTPAERRIVATVRGVLDDTFTYMKEAGVGINDLGFGKDYFPRVWDPQAILRNEAAFRDMLGRYKSQGVFKGSVEQVMAALTRSEGSDLQVETIKPGMQSAKRRVLDFVTGRDAEPFLNKNLYETLNSYVTQATRRAEWARRFGDDNAQLHQLFAQAEQQGATREHLQLASDYLQGVDGTLGDHIDPKLRRAFGNAIVYQNLRLLPLAVFSSVIDPMGILVRGGTMRDTFSAMKRGFVEMSKNFKKDAKHDGWTELAGQLGVIDNAVLMHNLGTSFSQGMTSNLGRKLNDTFFKYNLMEQYNTSMRVAATQAAVGFLARHADGAHSKHSARWLAELGFKPGEIKVKGDRPLITQGEFERAGLTPDDAQAAADKMTLAINKWVDGAILRPNAAHKPVWMNDPHFALIAHLKQFVYSFQETIMKRVANEARFGNVGPAYALAAYVPFMLAADSVKGMLQGGGEQPDWKKGWDASDYAFYEVQRAGLFGVGQFAVDAAKDLHRGGMGIGALVGPTVEQLGEAARTIGGAEQFKTFALNALPANALFDAAGNASAATNAVD